MESPSKFMILSDCRKEKGTWAPQDSSESTEIPGGAAGWGPTLHYLRAFHHYCSSETYPSSTHFLATSSSCLGNANSVECWPQFNFSKVNLIFLTPRISSKINSCLATHEYSSRTETPRSTSLFHQSGGMQTHFHVSLQRKPSW